MYDPIHNFAFGAFLVLYGNVAIPFRIDSVAERNVVGFLKAIAVGGRCSILRYSVGNFIVPAQIIPLTDILVQSTSKLSHILSQIKVFAIAIVVTRFKSGRIANGRWWKKVTL